jgi:hypothetical protein
VGKSLSTSHDYLAVLLVLSMASCHAKKSGSDIAPEGGSAVVRTQSASGRVDVPLPRGGVSLALPADAKVLTKEELLMKGSDDVVTITVAPRSAKNETAPGAVGLLVTSLKQFPGAYDRSKYEFAKAHAVKQATDAKLRKDVRNADGSYAIEYEYDKFGRHFRGFDYLYPPVADIALGTSFVSSQEDNGFTSRVLGGLAPGPIAGP